MNITGGDYRSLEYPSENNGSQRDTCADQCLIPNCCGCCDLKTGAMIILSFSLVSSILGFFNSAAQANGSSHNMFASLSGLIVTCWGFYAVMHDNAALLRSYVRIQVLLMILGLILDIVFLVEFSGPSGHKSCTLQYSGGQLPRGTDIDKFCDDLLRTVATTVGVTLSVALALRIYCILILWSYYRFLCRNVQLTVAFVSVAAPPTSPLPPYVPAPPAYEKQSHAPGNNSQKQ